MEDEHRPQQIVQVRYMWMYGETLFDLDSYLTASSGRDIPLAPVQPCSSIGNTSFKPSPLASWQAVIFLNTGRADPSLSYTLSMQQSRQTRNPRPGEQSLKLNLRLYPYKLKDSLGDRARSPVLIPPSTTVLSPAESGTDATDPFAAIAETVPPVEWKLPDFYREITSPKSPLHAFISGDVRDIACLAGVGTVYHVLAFQAAE
ncbi:hypothetical protein BS47DRAFT_1399737 [Hydnum rufescens UP504]|uniref:Uncharacterized protein n=1 Tax=Hydnum rufescens UP504 TaxID=1448309 RepID=A0A9P6DPB6_9AGAM|nr:hypothetical protein BS47DRAFT_1399737 [Hydnum rufescens UP504]